MLLAIGAGVAGMLVGIFIGWKLGVWGAVSMIERNLTPAQRAQLAAWNLDAYHEGTNYAKTR